MGLPASKPQGPVIEMGTDKFLDSDGNRVNVGNFDSDGLNVNNYWDDNRNSNLGVSASRQSALYPSVKSRLRAGFALSLFCRLDPASKHSADLINLRFKGDVLLVIDRLHIAHETDKDTEQI